MMPLTEQAFQDQVVKEQRDIGRRVMLENRDRDVETRPPSPPGLLDQCRVVVQRLNELGSMSRHLIAVVLGDRPADPRRDTPKMSTPPDPSTIAGFMHSIGDSLSEAEMNLGLVLQEIGK